MKPLRKGSAAGEPRLSLLGQYPTQGDALRRLDQFRLRLNLQHRFARPVTLDALVDDYVEKELPQLRYGT